MINKDFLKNLTLLYVEDDEIARVKLAKILKRIFKDVLLAANGLEGYILFQEQQLANQTIDLILSDINMPKMNGVEMLESIRELDSEVPIIYTTARTESEYLLRAIELNVNHYVLKPIDTEDIIMRIQKVCEKKYYENLIQSKNRELAQYLNIIDNVAVIIKIDDKGKVQFVNSLFLETSLYESAELVGKMFNSLVHEKMATSVLDEMWERLETGETWHSNIKYEDKEKNVFFINSTIFQVTSDEGNEYVNIGFLSTEEVNEKREFQKKIIKNIKESNIKAFESKNEILQLKHKDEQLELAISQLQNDLLKARTKNLKTKSHLAQYENDLLNIDKRIEKSLKIKNKEIQNHQESIVHLKKEKEIKTINNQKLMEDLEASRSDMDKMYDTLKLKEKRIETLLDLLEYREAQLREINPELVG
mgnify:FL=1